MKRRDFITTSMGAALAAGTLHASASQAPTSALKESLMPPEHPDQPSLDRHLKAKPLFHSPQGAEFQFGGVVGRRLEVNLREWLLVAPASNPAMLQMMRDRDRTPRRDLVPWAGEFAGKYLTSATQAYRLSRSAELRTVLEEFIREMAAAQAPDGYLGPFPKADRLVGAGLWDVWGHYHCLLGLMLWARETGDPAARQTCLKAADYLCSFFLEGGKRVVDAGSEEMNESIAHVMLLLFEWTGNERYLRLAREVEKDWEKPPSGDYVRVALAGKAFYQCPKPRWESLHSVQAIAELYFVMGEARYRQSLEQLWWSIVEGDRHNTGGFSSGEAACGDPYNRAAIETCCTIAWFALSVDMLRMTGDSRVADELEISFWNAILGAMSPTGRWWTYNTPMDGERKASAHEIVFQARAGSSELNCCSVNGPRGLGELSEWAVMASPRGIVLNYYGPSSITTRTPAGRKVSLRQDTKYPTSGAIKITVSPEEPEQFVLKLRIPGWSRRTEVRVAGQAAAARPGEYLDLDRLWKPGDQIELTLDMSPRFWAGEKECQGRASLYLGPLLLAYDPRFDTPDPTALPSLEAGSLTIQPLEWSVSPLPISLVRVTDGKGISLALCDFASAGAAGNQYVSWLPLEGVQPVVFSRENPMRISQFGPRSI